MNYALIKILNDAGFPFKKAIYGADFTMYVGEDENDESGQLYYTPTLEELIEACGDTVFFDLVKCKDGWVATDHYLRGDGATPKEAVANFWLIQHGNRG